MNRLKGKVAVVTGASKGIGAAIAEHLAAEGAAVVANYSSSKAGAEAVVRRITEREGKAIAVQADVSKQADIRRLFAETKKAFGKVDILVNNAGIYEFQTAGSDHARALPQTVRSECARATFGDSGGCQADGSRRRQRHQHQLGRGDARAAEQLRL